MIKPQVVIPTAAGIGLGLYLRSESSFPSGLGETTMVGGLVTGAFAWAQSISEQLKNRRNLQIQLAAGTDLRWADLAGVDLNRSYLRQRAMTGIRLSDARCYESDFSFSELREARLANGRFVRARFDAADLTAASCYKARLRWSSLRGANLQGASLCWADLRNSDLTNADLRNADLRGARLSGAVLEGAKLRGCWTSPSTRWPLPFEPLNDDVPDPHERVRQNDDSEGDPPTVDLTDDRWEPAHH